MKGGAKKYNDLGKVMRIKCHERMHEKIRVFKKRSDENQLFYLNFSNLP